MFSWCLAVLLVQCHSFSLVREDVDNAEISTSAYQESELFEPRTDMIQDPTGTSFQQTSMLPDKVWNMIIPTRNSFHEKSENVTVLSNESKMKDFAATEVTDRGKSATEEITEITINEYFGTELVSIPPSSDTKETIVDEVPTVSSEITIAENEFSTGKLLTTFFSTKIPLASPNEDVSTMSETEANMFLMPFEPIETTTISETDFYGDYMDERGETITDKREVAILSKNETNFNSFNFLTSVGTGGKLTEAFATNTTYTNVSSTEERKTDDVSFGFDTETSTYNTDSETTEGMSEYESEDELTTEVATTEEGGFKEKAIDNGGASKIQDLLEKPVVWNGPTVKTQSVKTKANWTTTVLNGEALYTDISVYQSHGLSYMFRIPGGLPEDMPGGIIAWVRNNNHKYPHTDISYKEFGSDVVENQAPPTELPLRCGTKFLEKLSGGKVTPIEDNPWQVAVLRRDTEAYVCGGAVITRRHVISAAHCFKRHNHKFYAKHILLRVGDYDKEVREESQIDYSVTELKLHERYHEKRHLHDIALLTTSGDIPFSSHVYPICLPPPWAQYTAGIQCTVSGWGQVGISEETTRYLRAGQVAIVSHDDCRKKTIFSKGVPPEIFCAEDPTKKGVDTCLGDSGGPFACSRNGTYYLYGITAFGSYPCGQDIPSFYTNVSFYKLWILHELSKSKNSTDISP